MVRFVRMFIPSGSRVVSGLRARSGMVVDDDRIFVPSRCGCFCRSAYPQSHKPTRVLSAFTSLEEGNVHAVASLRMFIIWLTIVKVGGGAIHEASANNGGETKPAAVSLQRQHLGDFLNRYIDFSKRLHQAMTEVARKT